VDGFVDCVETEAAFFAEPLVLHPRLQLVFDEQARGAKLGRSQLGKYLDGAGELCRAPQMFVAAMTIAETAVEMAVTAPQKGPPG
jgi:hypothetical protein